MAGQWNRSHCTVSLTAPHVLARLPWRPAASTDLDLIENGTNHLSLLCVFLRALKL